MKYNPNWNDPRVQRRVNRSIDYALATLSPTKPKSWGTRQLDHWFGNQSNPLSSLIRSQLLIVTDNFYNPDKGITKKYLLNTQGLAKLGNKVNRTFIPCALHLQQHKISSADTLFGKTVESGEFVYREKSNRLWNEIQNLSNDVRKPLFANYGYVHEYDIKSAAPNILNQYARQCGLTRPTPTLDQYLNDPETARADLANQLSVDRKTAKQLITSRFAGARFGAQNSIIQQLDNRWIAHNRLKADPWFEDLTKDIKKLWDAIKKHEGQSRMNSRVKWDIYFREELRVMKSVHRYLDKHNCKYFHEHDGWRSDSSVDLRDLKLHIQKQTGYWLEFDYDVYEK